MSNITNLENYFKEPKSFKLGADLFVVNEGSDVYLSWKAEMIKLEKEKKELDEIEMFELAFKYAFGADKAKQIINAEFNGVKMPIKVFNQMYTEILEAWIGRPVTPSDK